MGRNGARWMVAVAGRRRGSGSWRQINDAHRAGWGQGEARPNHLPGSGLRSNEIFPRPGAAAFFQPMSSPPAPVAARRASSPSILNPVVDFLCVGGLSLIVFIPLLLSGRTDLVLIGAGAQAWLATAINMPHFMASYRIIYRSKEMILKHKWASIYVPAILLVYIAFALWEAQQSPVLVVILISVSSAYLAW